MPKAKPFEDLTGNVYNSWRVLKFAGRKPVGIKTINYRPYWKCRCKKCGRKKDVSESSLLRGNSRQCHQCANSKPRSHGETQARTLKRRHNPLFYAWNTLRSNFDRSQICPDWLVLEGGQGFKAFCRAVGKKPQPSRDYKLRRIDSTKPWKPGNIHWFHWRPSGQKTWIYQGEEHTAGELAFMAGIHLNTMNYRLRHMSVDDAVNCAVAVHSRQEDDYTAFNETKTLREWEADPRMVVGRKRFFQRLRMGWDVQRAISEPARVMDGSQVVYEAFGERKTLEEWEKDRRYKVKDRVTFHGRIGNGWTAQQAMSGRKKKCDRHKLYRAFGEQKTLSEWEKEGRLLVNRNLFHSRIKRGWDAERAMTEPRNANYDRSQLRAVESPLVVKFVGMPAVGVLKREAL